MKNQHRYDEISADRSVPIPLQPPHLLQFDTIMFPYRNEKLTYAIMFSRKQNKTKHVSRASTFEGQGIVNLGDAHFSSGGRQMLEIFTPDGSNMTPVTRVSNG